MTSIMSAAAVYGDQSVWSRVLDVAGMLTALIACVAAVLATWLSLRTVRIANSENDRGRQEFLYSQVSSVLEAALSLVSAAKGLDTVPNPTDTDDRRTLHGCADSVHSRLRVLISLKLINEEEHGIKARDVRQFADSLVKVGLARQKLHRSGRTTLMGTLLSESSDVTGTTADLLNDLSQQVHGTAFGTTDTYGEEIPESDGQGISNAFDGSESATASLKKRLAFSETCWSQNESLRLLIPWVKVELGWWEPLEEPDGTICGLDDSSMYDYVSEDSGTPTQVPGPEKVVADWLNSWPTRYWQSEDMHEMLRAMDDYTGSLPTKTPEALIDELLDDFCDEFLDRLLGLIARLRDSLPESQLLTSFGSSR